MSATQTTQDDPAREAEPGRWRKGTSSGSSLATNHSDSWSERHWTSRLLHRAGEFTSHSAAGILATSLIAAWLLLGVVVAFPHWWEASFVVGTGSVTFVMVFVIQHTQERQITATQRKLDELIRSSQHADDRLIAVEEAPDHHLQDLADSSLADRERVVQG